MTPAMIGDRHGRWVIIGSAPNSPSRATMLRCRCDCGTEKNVNKHSLLYGITTSCGCFRQERAKETRTHGHASKGLTPAYRSWAAMRSRCTNPNATDYDIYGGRGISIDPRWDDYATFLADMGDRPAGTTLDRIDSNGNYEPSNCRWSTYAEQAINKRNTPLTLHERNQIGWLVHVRGYRQTWLASAFEVSQATISRVAKRAS